MLAQGTRNPRSLAPPTAYPGPHTLPSKLGLAAVQPVDDVVAEHIAVVVPESD